MTELNVFQKCSRTITIMAKHKQKSKTLFDGQSGQNTPKKMPTTLSEIRQDQNLWYKIKVLIYDFHNIEKDPSCRNRIDRATDVQYIGAPYFTEEEATAIKAAIVEGADGTTSSIEQALYAKFERSNEKRQARGDHRPCGPHDLGPVYLECFGIDKAELQDEKFVSRVRRSGLGS